MSCCQFPPSQNPSDPDPDPDGISSPRRSRMFQELHGPQGRHQDPRLPRKVPQQPGLHLHDLCPQDVGDRGGVWQLRHGARHHAAAGRHLPLRLPRDLGRLPCRWAPSGGWSRVRRNEGGRGGWNVSWWRDITAFFLGGLCKRCLSVVCILNPGDGGTGAESRAFLQMGGNWERNMEENNFKKSWYFIYCIYVAIHPVEVTELSGGKGKKYHHSFRVVVSSSFHPLPLTEQLSFPAASLTPKHPFELGGTHTRLQTLRSLRNVFLSILKPLIVSSY